MIPLKTQFGTAFEADFENNTWTFQMPPDYEVRAGEFAIVDKQIYEKLIKQLSPDSELFKELV